MTTQAVSPSADNYTLGKGIAYFNRKNPTTGLWEGERDLGDVSELTFNVSLETLEHYSHRGGIRSLDKEAELSADLAFSFIMDEPTPENTALNVLGTVNRIAQAAADISKVLTGVLQRRYYDLEKREVGIYKLQYKTGTAAWAEDEVVSGAVGEGTIKRVVITSGTAVGGDEAGYLYIVGVTPGFVLDEAITGDVAGAAAVAAVEVMDPALLVVTDGAGTHFDVTTDFTVDHGTGRIYIVPGGGIADEDDITVIGSCAETTYTRIDTLKDSDLEGRFRFVADNPVGLHRELYIPRAKLTPSGDTALIGEEWGTISIDGKVLRDTTKTTGSEYMDVIMD